MTDGAKLSDIDFLGGAVTPTDLLYLVRAAVSYKILVSQLRITSAQLSDATTFGRDILSAADAAAVRTLLSLGALAVLNSVGTSQIDDASVTIAEMDDLPEGSLIVGDASNRPAIVSPMAAIADGTDDESTPYTGIDNTVVTADYAQLTDLNALAAAYEDLRAKFNTLLAEMRTLGILTT